MLHDRCRPLPPPRSLKPSQPKAGKLNAEQTSQMLTAACQQPSAKRLGILDAAHALAKGGQGRRGPADVLGAFGVKMQPQLVEVQVGRCWGCCAQAGRAGHCCWGCREPLQLLRSAGRHLATTSRRLLLHLQARLLPPPPLRYKEGRVLRFDTTSKQLGQWNMQVPTAARSLLLRGLPCRRAPVWGIMP
jgi:hypothetical protein